MGLGMSAQLRLPDRAAATAPQFRRHVPSARISFRATGGWVARWTGGPGAFGIVLPSAEHNVNKSANNPLLCSGLRVPANLEVSSVHG